MNIVNAFKEALKNIVGFYEIIFTERWNNALGCLNSDRKPAERQAKEEEIKELLTLFLQQFQVPHGTRKAEVHYTGARRKYKNGSPAFGSESPASEDWYEFEAHIKFHTSPLSNVRRQFNGKENQYLSEEIWFSGTYTDVWERPRMQLGPITQNFDYGDTGIKVHLIHQRQMVIPVGFEPTTTRLKVKCSTS